jgi:hypothetical protein
MHWSEPSNLTIVGNYILPGTMSNYDISKWGKLFDPLSSTRGWALQALWLFAISNCGSKHHVLQRDTKILPFNNIAMTAHPWSTLPPSLPHYRKKGWSCLVHMTHIRGFPMNQSNTKQKKASTSRHLVLCYEQRDTVIPSCLQHSLLFVTVTKSKEW